MIKYHCSGLIAVVVTSYAIVTLLYFVLSYSANKIAFMLSLDFLMKKSYYYAKS